jgi:carbonic anhydrase
VSFGAGLTKIPFKTFALVTFFGMAPSTFAFTYLGSSMSTAQWPLIAAVAAAVLFFLAMPRILTQYRRSAFARLSLTQLPIPAAVHSTKSGIPLPIGFVGCGSAIGKLKTLFKFTRMFCSQLLALLLIVGTGTGWAAEEHGVSHWSYEGQESAAYWGMLSPAYMVCEAGSHQSPINITMPRHATMQERVSFHYQSASVRTLDNGHTIQVNVPPGSELHLNGRAYRLEQFHFHEPSEHHVDGRTYPMEIHLVHRDIKGHVVVIGLLVEAGFPNQTLAELWTMLPTKAGEQGPEHTFNPRALLPPGTHHVSYHGSLTTPPCNEGVQWIVLRDPVTMSAQQVEQFVSVIGHNARPIQPLHERQIREE